MFRFVFSGLQVDGDGLVRESFLKENSEDTSCVGGERMAMNLVTCNFNAFHILLILV